MFVAKCGDVWQHVATCMVFVTTHGNTIYTHTYIHIILIIVVVIIMIMILIILITLMIRVTAHGNTSPARQRRRPRSRGSSEGLRPRSAGLKVKAVLCCAALSYDLSYYVMI